MTTEKFDRRQWSRRDKLIYRNGIYDYRGVDYDRGMILISDGVNNSFWVPFERIEIYNQR